jgi:meso-butanediol dehydrogenase/(S,S)-butanediol dehydrogenase/diacetyl reductase
MGRLDGKVAIVTGAGQGVGRGIALALAGEGASIVVAGRTLAKCEDTVAELARRGQRGIAVLADVEEAADCDALVARTVDELGTVDILVNNAQDVPLGRLLDVTDEAAESAWRSGPLATLRLMRACHPHLRGGGVVVNLGTAASLRPDPVGYGAYAAVKEAIRAMSRAAACEWGPDGIRVHVVVPLSSSPGMDAWRAAVPEEYEAFMTTVPLGRLGDPEADIGKAVVFLCSDDSSYITGQTLIVDGGQAFLR